MKLDGVITSEGLRLLERSFVPVSQKFGSSCCILFTPQKIYLLQPPEEGGDVHTCASIDNVREMSYESDLN